ncbi:MAG: MFS transporter [Chloroflexi bacterium]|nr:MFS transporter [Chloroflexota bacterium]
MADLSSRASDAPARGVFSAVLVLTLARTCVNMTRRFTYTFVPEIARSLGVANSAVQNVIAAQSGVSFLSPFVGGIADRFGRKYVMAGAMIAFGVLGLLGAAFTTYSAFFLMMIGFGVGKMLFDPAALAYLGDRVPFARRATAVGINEMSWGGALLIAAPMTGLLLERATLSAVFLALGIVNFAGALAVILLLPADRPSKEARALRVRIRPLAVLRHPVVVASSLYAGLNAAANELVFINYGAFMDASFGLALSALGFVTIAISVAEGVGEGIVAALGDRVGTKRVALMGLGIAAACYVALPLFASSLTLATAGIFLLFFGYEIAVVAAIPLYTELVPGQRASVLGTIIGFIALGRFAGGLLGGVLYAAGGPSTIAIAAGVTALVAMFILARWVRVTSGG